MPILKTLKGSEFHSLWLVLLRLKLIQDFMVVLVTCKNKEDTIKMVTIFIIHQFLRTSRAAYSIIGDGIWSKFKLIQAFMVVLVTPKNEEVLFNGA